MPKPLSAADREARARIAEIRRHQNIESDDAIVTETEARKICNVTNGWGKGVAPPPLATIGKRRFYRRGSLTPFIRAQSIKQSIEASSDAENYDPETIALADKITALFFDGYSERRPPGFF